MTNDGRWVLTWDGENRSTKVESLATSPTASKRKVVWEYDAKGRRIRQTTYDGSSGSYVVTEDLKFLSDGWQNIAELNATNNALVRSYVWGTDLGGMFGGAGGIGGLLMINSTANGAHFVAYDGAGNVAALVSAAGGSVSAVYEYEPFGRTIRSTGAMAKENRFRFSTKRTDDVWLQH
jgi:YD repeat-containing protein